MVEAEWQLNYRVLSTKTQHDDFGHAVVGLERVAKNTNVFV